MLELYRNIRDCRLARGWSQTELAMRVGYADKSMISRIESGKVDLAQSQIKKFADVFGVTPGQLMGRDGTFEDVNAEAIRILNRSLRLRAEETQILESYRAAPEAIKEAVKKLLDVT